MASLMRDCFQKLDVDIKPRIIGLTASFVNGSLKNIFKKRAELETLLEANIISPVIPPLLEEADESRKFHNVSYREDVPEDTMESVSECIDLLLEGIPSGLTDNPEKAKAKRKAMMVLKELGTQGVYYYLKEGLIRQLEREADHLLQLGDENPQRKGHALKRSVDEWQSALSHDGNTVTFEKLQSLDPWISHKLKELLLLLNQLYTLSDGDGDFRVIVFVEQVALCYPITYCINRYFEPILKSVVSAFEIEEGAFSRPADLHRHYRPLDPDRNIAMCVSGASSMNDTTREGNLTKFRSGKVHILVSTNALEEGIDVPSCSAVIRYNKVPTTKGHIQGSGRARSAMSDIFNFGNDKDDEIRGAHILDAAAKDTSLNLTRGEIALNLQKENCRSPESLLVEYPFFPHNDSALGHGPGGGG